MATSVRPAPCGPTVALCSVAQRLPASARQAPRSVRLEELLADHDPTPLRADDLVIDTDVITADEAADRIAEVIEQRRSTTDGSHVEELRSANRFNELAAMQVAAGCILRDTMGHVLIVDPAYKDRWELPGGAVEPNESPLQACRREVAEELSLEVNPQRLVCADHQTTRPPRRQALRFILDGGQLDDRSLNAITLDPTELQNWKLVPVEYLDSYLNQTVANRVCEGLRTPGIYLENGKPLSD